MATKKNVVKKKNKHSKSKNNKISSTKNNKGKKKNSPQKRSAVGFEVELFILDKNGKVVNEADRLLKKVEEKKRNLNSDIVKEHGKNQIEVNTYPGLASIDTLRALIENLKLLLYTAEEEELMICPLGTYPGKFSPELRQGYYKAEEKLHGKERFKNSARTVGFHWHYELPWGVFDKKKLTLKKLINSKNKESLINAYNFLIAADPALTTFMQSSPFYQGKYYGKDARLAVWRGSEVLNFPDGLYAKHQMFGGLPSYEHTATNLLDLIQTRYDIWMDSLKEAGVKQNVMPKFRSILDTNWTPVRINSHGTFEQRGLDMNHLQIIFSVSEVIRIIMQEIEQEYIKVEITDSAIDEPFKYERKTIFIPPDSYVKNELQKLAAFEGMKSESVWYYCKRLLDLAKLFGGKKIGPAIEILEKMIQDKKTISDEIIDEVKKLGYKDFSKIMPADIAAQIALSHSQRLFKEIVLAEKFIK